MHFRATGSGFGQRSDILRLEDKGSLDESRSVCGRCDPRHSPIRYVNKLRLSDRPLVRRGLGS